MKKRISLLFALATVVAGAGIVLSGCISMGGAIAAMSGGGNASSQAPASGSSSSQASGGSSSSAPSGGSPGSAMAYQYQFNAFYGSYWTGWWAGEGSHYQVGQGTVWQISSSNGGSRKPITFERALLKVNADNSEWWHLKFDTGDQTIVYEFLVGPDHVVAKVRYRDPQSNTVGEFVPNASSQQPSNGPAPMTKDQMAQYITGQESIQVPAGTFTADHILYTDQDKGFRVEAWGSAAVPGGLIKSIATNLNNHVTSTTELIQIESGVGTELGSY